MENNAMSLKKFGIIMMITYVFSGAGSVIVQQIMNDTKILGQYFAHPFILTLIMFFSEASCYLFYFLIQKYRFVELQMEEEAAKEKGLDLNIKVYYILIPVVLDFLGSSLNLISLIFMPGSVYEMLGGLQLVTMAFFSRLILKSVISKNQWLGVFVCFLGVTVVGLSDILFNQTESEGLSGQIIGIIFFVTSVILDTFQLIICERLFDKYHIHPLKFVGIEGLWGLLIMAIVLPILNFVPCNSPDICVLDDGKRYVERINIVFDQISDTPTILIPLFFFYLVLIAYNYSLQTIIKVFSALTEEITSVLEVFVTWGVGIIITVSFKSRGEFQFESLEAKVIGVQMVGFCLIIMGNSLYNGFIVLIKDKNTVKHNIFEALNQVQVSVNDQISENLITKDSELNQY